MPGRVAQAVAPDVIRRLAARLTAGAVIVTGTNGKTTTSRLISHIAHAAGLSPVHNRAGANLASGIAAALVHHASALGMLRGDLGVFEVDEATLPVITGTLVPRSIVLTNLFRDQLDRYGEIDLVAGRWQRALSLVPAHTAVIFNADDPLVADVGTGYPGPRLAFGIADASCGVGTMEHAADARYCYRCGSRYHYEAVYFGHMGLYHCEGCGWRRPVPDVVATDVRMLGIAGTEFTVASSAGSRRVRTPLPGVYNVHNVLAAAAACLQLGISLDTIAARIETFAPAFGRAESIRLDDREAVVLLAKNPAGFNEVLRTVLKESKDSVVLIAINDLTADGRDISWLWDVDFEMLASGSAPIIVSGLRAEDMALRLRYAGVDDGRVLRLNALDAAVDAARARAGAGERIFMLPTYTAMLELRRILQQRGLVRRFWEQ
ncbi:MAG TPA: MurT ligase domain-containing protein [bacterium]|nr:MurT ligase domain-containing protein [bacterium]